MKHGHYLLELFRSHFYQLLGCGVVIKIYDRMLWLWFILLAMVLPSYYFSICKLLFKISLNLQETNILYARDQTACKAFGETRTTKNAKLRILRSLDMAI